jgi:hypothetical protein
MKSRFNAVVSLKDYLCKLKLEIVTVYFETMLRKNEKCIWKENGVYSGNVETIADGGIYEVFVGVYFYLKTKLIQADCYSRLRSKEIYLDCFVVNQTTVTETFCCLVKRERLCMYNDVWFS